MNVGEPVMKHQSPRIEKLRHTLSQGRENLCERLKTLRRHQNLEAVSSPGDVMDVAKSLVDAETHASIVERAERQLSQINSALLRLDDGQYGICLDCGEEIPFERLKAIPSALFCIGCQSSGAEESSRSHSA
jgi:DnaK suppressor protein